MQHAAMLSAQKDTNQSHESIASLDTVSQVAFRFLLQYYQHLSFKLACRRRTSEEQVLPILARMN